MVVIPPLGPGEINRLTSVGPSSQPSRRPDTGGPSDAGSTDLPEFGPAAVYEPSRGVDPSQRATANLDFGYDARRLAQAQTPKSPAESGALPVEAEPAAPAPPSDVPEPLSAADAGPHLKPSLHNAIARARAELDDSQQVRLRVLTGLSLDKILPPNRESQSAPPTSVPKLPPEVHRNTAVRLVMSVHDAVRDAETALNQARLLSSLAPGDGDIRTRSGAGPRSTRLPGALQVRLAMLGEALGGYRAALHATGMSMIVRTGRGNGPAANVMEQLQTAITDVLDG